MHEPIGNQFKIVYVQTGYWRVQTKEVSKDQQLHVGCSCESKQHFSLVEHVYLVTAIQSNRRFTTAVPPRQQCILDHIVQMSNGVPNLAIPFMVKGRLIKHSCTVLTPIQDRNTYRPQMFQQIKQQAGAWHRPSSAASGSGLLVAAVQSRGHIVAAVQSRVQSLCLVVGTISSFINESLEVQSRSIDNRTWMPSSYLVRICVYIPL